MYALGMILSPLFKGRLAGVFRASHRMTAMSISFASTGPSNTLGIISEVLHPLLIALNSIVAAMEPGSWKS